MILLIEASIMNDLTYRLKHLNQLLLVFIPLNRLTGYQLISYKSFCCGYVW